MASVKLPFELFGRLADQRSVIVTVHVDDTPITSEKFQLGNGKRRREIAELWSKDDRLTRGDELDANDILHELDKLEQEAFEAIRNQEKEDSAKKGLTEVSNYVDDAAFVELAWNEEKGGVDFIIFYREDRIAERADSYDVPGGTLVPPAMCPGIVTPHSGHPGAVFVPTKCDASGEDEAAVRRDVAEFIARYVELPGGTLQIAIEYVFLTWVYDRFDEVSYLGFRTADVGRGKSRALETVGSLCYRPLMVGGGSTAAATLRMLDTFAGTLLGDEFDHNANSELAGELTRIINQGFQRNRPIVRCDGENNEPRPFRCFGPKIFALRGQFGDDASESRMITIRMEQRTRQDIPISLPRREFESRALAIRNRLLSWRFTHWDQIKVNPDLADPELEDRANQIGLPLLSVAKDQGSRQRIVEALRGQQQEVAETRLDSLEGQVLEAAFSISHVGGTVRPKAVAEEVNRRIADSLGLSDVSQLKKPIGARKVGHILRKGLELAGHRDGQGWVYELSESRVTQLAQRYAIPILEQRARRTDVHCPEENQLFSSENADSCTSERHVRSAGQPDGCRESHDDGDGGGRETVCI